MLNCESASDEIAAESFINSNALLLIMKRYALILTSMFVLFVFGVSVVFASIQAPPNMPPIIDPPPLVDVPPLFNPGVGHPSVVFDGTVPPVSPPNKPATPPASPPRKINWGWKVVVMARCSGLEPILHKPFHTAVDGETACYSTKEEAELAAENTLIPYLSRKCREELKRTGITENYVFRIIYKSAQWCELPQYDTTKPVIG